MLDLLTTFRTVSANSVPDLAPFFNGFFSTRANPRFYMSSLWLGAKSEFIWGVVDGCLCVVKRRVMYKSTVIYLILPPMSSSGDIEAEKRVLMAFRQAGVGARLSSEDVELYGMADDVTEEPGNSEYVYRAGDHDDMSGQRWKNARQQRQELNSCCEITHYTSTLKTVAATCAAIDEAWETARRANGGPKSLGTSSTKHVVDGFAEHSRYSRCMAYVVKREKRPIMYAVGQEVAPGKTILLVGRHIFEGVRDAALAQHLIEMCYWRSVGGPDTLLNSGASVGVTGLATMKERLRPVARLQIYQLKTDRKLTLEDYHRTKPAPAPPAKPLGGFGFHG